LGYLDNPGPVPLSQLTDGQFRPSTDVKKKNLLATYSKNLVEGILDVDEKVVFTLLQKEVNLSSLHHNEENEMKKLKSILRSKSKRPR
jgi:hypothetical protein